jgi:hypothetical protein
MTAPTGEAWLWLIGANIIACLLLYKGGFGGRSRGVPPPPKPPEIHDITPERERAIITDYQGELKMHNHQNTNTTFIASKWIGEYVIVRSQNEGVNFGRLIEADPSGVVIAEARRVWYHRPADKSLSWYEGVAISGLSSDSKISCAVPIKVIIEDYSITLCTDLACESIKAHKPHVQS